MGLTDVLKQHVIKPSSDAPLFHDQVLKNITDETRIVVLGSSTYGTDKFIREKALITEHLIKDHGFDGILMDIDFTSLVRPHLFLWGLHTGDLDAQQALKDANEWPAWLLRNQSFVNFLTLLREHNVDLKQQQEARKLGVVLFGLDCTCLDYAVSALAEATELPEAVRAKAVARYLHIKQGTGQGTLVQKPQNEQPTEERQLSEDDIRLLARVVSERVFKKLHTLLQSDAQDSFTASLFSEEAAFEVFKKLFLQDDMAWGTWSNHLASTVTAVEKHLSEVHSRPSKVVIWCHSSLARPARGWAGGSLTDTLRDRYSEKEVYAIDMTTSYGTVAAPSLYNNTVQCQELRPAAQGTLERALHDITEDENSVLGLDLGHAHEQLQQAVMQGSVKMRSLGLVYSPDSPSEHQYTDVQLKGLDMLLFFKHTNALLPLDVFHTEWGRGGPVGGPVGGVGPAPVEKLDDMQEELKDAAKLFNSGKEH